MSKFGLFQLTSDAERPPRARAWALSPRQAGLSLGLALILVLSAWGAWKAGNDSPAPQEKAPAQPPATAAYRQPPVYKLNVSGPEALLLDIHEDALRGRHQQALARAHQLTKDFPNFQLGQLFYAELLNLSLDQPFNPESMDLRREKQKLARAPLDLLLHELRQRRSSLAPAAPAGWLPRNFLQLHSTQPYALAVDISKSRLYLFGNRDRLGTPGSSSGPTPWVLLADAYISAGLHGVGKQVEGDAKTPEGVYFVGSKPPNRSLPDLYGAGALTLNYPNALDHLRGKTGSGIWLHGTSQSEYSRPPLDSDGCVVLTNTDMQRLQTLPIRGAPIVIAHQLDWAEPRSISKERDAFYAVLERWHPIWQSGQEAALKPFYSERFLRGGESLATWWPQLVKHAKAQTTDLKSQLKSILRWTDQGGDHMVVTLQDSTSDALRRLYWAKEGADWKIIFEGPSTAVADR